VQTRQSQLLSNTNTFPTGPSSLEIYLVLNIMAMTTAMSSSSASKTQAETYLQALLCKTLRITTTDKRMFLGQFKCTDSVRAILSFSASLAFLPSPPHRPTSLTTTCTSFLTLTPLSPLTSNITQDQNIILSQTYEYTPPTSPSKAELERASLEGKESLKLDMTSRFLGLVVVPGEHIVKIQVEEFASQLKKR